MEEVKEPKIYHKIEAGKKYRVWKSTHNDKNYYKIQVSQKNYDGTVDKFYIDLQFKKGVDIPNQSDIIIKCAYENLRKNINDEYHPIVYLMITDFELIKSDEQVQQEAFDEFRENLDDVEIQIDDNFLD